MKSLFVVLAFVALAYASTVGVAHLKGTTTEPAIDGTVYFVVLNSSYVWVWAKVSGIANNPNVAHGMHVHQWGDVSDMAAGSSVGAHYVGAGASSHSCYPNTTRHEGDMGNWDVSSGAFTQAKTLDLLDVMSTNSIIGKAVVLHNLTDDCGASGLATGNAGGRLALGVIGIANPAFYPSAVADVVASLGQTGTSNTAISGDTTITKAVAILMPTQADSAFPNVYGAFYFEQDTTTNYVTVTGMVYNLPQNYAYGVHIHTFADWFGTGGAVDGTGAGGHYNSTPVSHAGPTNDSRHNGDLGNICAFSVNATYYSWVMQDNKFTLNGANNILGRNIIVHNAYDAMTPTAPLGKRVSQGVIGVLNSATAVSSRVTLPSVTFDPLCAAYAGATPAPTPAPTQGPTNKPSSTSSSPVGTTSSSSALFASVFVVVFAAFVAMF